MSGAPRKGLKSNSMVMANSWERAASERCHRTAGRIQSPRLKRSTIGTSAPMGSIAVRLVIGVGDEGQRAAGVEAHGGLGEG